MGPAVAQRPGSGMPGSMIHLTWLSDDSTVRSWSMIVAIMPGKFSTRTVAEDRAGLRRR